MNVVLFAWCPSSIAYLSALEEAGALPRLVVTGQHPGLRPDKPGYAPDPGPRSSAAAPLAEACARLGAPLERCPDINAPAFVERVAGLSPDLLLVAGCAQILGPAILALPRRGALNFHPSRLPAYRGKEPLFWALLHGASTVAITVHHVTTDVDAGPIIFQRDVPVPPGATSATLAAIVDLEGAALIPRVLDLAAKGALPAGELPSSPGSHYPPLRPEHGLIDFTRSAEEIDRLVRAAQGEIAAYCFYRGMRLIVLDGAPLPASGPIVPGRVLSIAGDVLVVGAQPGAYGIRRFFFLNRGYAAAALSAELGISPGDAFTHNPAVG